MAGKGGKRRALEREFEELLLDVLEQDYDLAVRQSTDRMERRKRDVATLEFEYHHESASQAKAVVRVASAPSFKAMLPVDWSSPDALRRSAEDCEALVLFLTEHLEEMREKTLTAVASGKLRYGRREDD